jgi:hypothetical protein
MVAMTAQLTLAQISVKFYHGDRDIQHSHLHPIWKWPARLMEPRLTTKLYFDGNGKCNKVLTDISLGVRSDKGQQHRQMFTYRALCGVLEV